MEFNDEGEEVDAYGGEFEPDSYEDDFSGSDER